MISKRKFVKIINRLKETDELQNKINELYKSTKEAIISDFDNVSYVGIYFEDIVFDLLINIFNDKNNWIGYWLYELDYGKKYTNGCVTDGDGIIIDISTPERLYDFLIDNMKKDGLNEE